MEMCQSSHVDGFDESHTQIAGNRLGTHPKGKYSSSNCTKTFITIITVRVHVYSYLLQW